MSCAKAFCCSCGVGAPPDPDDVVVVLVESVAGVLVVAVVDVVVLVVVEDAEEEVAAAEDGWPVGLKIRPGPTCGIPIVLQTYCCRKWVSSCKFSLNNAAHVCTRKEAGGGAGLRFLTLPSQQESCSTYTNGTLRKKFANPRPQFIVPFTSN